MALGTTFTKSIFGLEVLKETTPNSFINPTKPLCIEKGTTFPQPEFKKMTCDPMTDDKYEIITNADSSAVTVSQDLYTPLVAKLGGVEDLFIACGMKKTVAAPNTDFTPRSEWADRLSAQITGLRKTMDIKGLAGTFTITMIAGEMLKMNFELKGTLNGQPINLNAGDADNTIPFNSLVPDDMLWVKQKCGVLINGSQMWIKSAVLELGVDITLDETFCGNVAMTDKSSKLKLLIKNTEQNETPVSDLSSATEYNIVLSAYNNAGDEKFQLQVPKAAVEADAESDNNGFFETERTFTCKKTVKDDNFTLRFID